MPSDRSIVALAEARNQVNVSSGQSLPNGEDLDDYLEYLIDLASGQIEDAIENKVAVQSVTVTLNGNGESTLNIPYYPIASIADVTAVQYRISVSGGWSNLVSDANLIFFSTEEPSKITLLDGGVFPVGEKNIKLVYNAGWSAIPSVFVRQCLERVHVMYNQNRGIDNTLGVTSISKSSAGGNENWSYRDLSDKWLQELKDAGFVDTSNIVGLCR